MLKVLYITNIFPNYRIALWKGLINSDNFSLKIMFGKKNLDRIKNAEIDLSFSNYEKSKFIFLKNYRFFGRIFFQSKSITASLSEDYDVFIILGDMTIISNWISAILARIRGKKVIFWTHGIYGNESIIKLFVRLIFLSLADSILLYENRAKKLLIKNGFKSENLNVVYNSLDYNKQKEIFLKLSKTKTKTKKTIKKLIFIGRLTKVKKLDLLITAINNLNKNNIEYSLTIIGDGPEKKKLLNLSKSGIQKKYIRFKGEMYDEKKIGALIFNSDLCVSPGNVGLTCIHSLSYGTPVCTHGNFKYQMPEAEAIVEGVSGIFFKEGNLNDLEFSIIKWFNKYNGLFSRDKIRSLVDDKYNPSNQIKIISKTINRWQN